LLALLGAHHFLHVNRIRVKLLTFRRLMSYIYIYIYDISRLRVKPVTENLSRLLKSSKLFICVMLTHVADRARHVV